jgi:hypothetical protein
VIAASNNLNCNFATFFIFFKFQYFNASSVLKAVHSQEQGASRSILSKISGVFLKNLPS